MTFCDKAIKTVILLLIIDYSENSNLLKKKMLFFNGFKT